MPTPAHLSLFVIAALALLLTPGPAVLYIVARSASQGRLAGLVSVLGIQTGGLVHVCGAALGVSALLLSSALAFNVVKYLGAAYLIYLGVRKLLTREEHTATADRPPEPLARIFWQAVVVNALNPKTALFFLAFLPQFISPEQGQVSLQLTLLGLLFIGLAVITDGSYALLASALAGRLRGGPGSGRVTRYLAGSIYIGLGLTAALVSGETQQ